jgi:hypothetical protein
MENGSEELLLLRNVYQLVHLEMDHCLVTVLLAVRNIAIKLIPLTYHRSFNLPAKEEDAVKHFQSFAVIPITKLFCLGHEIRVNVGF